MNICIISGSARSNNNTLRVGKALKLRMEDLGCTVSLVDFQEYDLPLINQGQISRELFTPFQSNLANSMEQAQVVVLITPEYNWSTTPEILNFLHRLGDVAFASLFNQKVFATVGVSTGKGGKAPALHLHTILNKIISFTNLDSMVSAKIFESHFTKEVLDVDGQSLQNQAYDKGLDEFIAFTMRVGKRWSQPLAL
jgi:chromate reductase, NAD(P)H dehydrogenase (quinone)